MVDRAEYEKSWTQAAAYFRGAVPKDKWSAMVRGVREPLGAMKSREKKSARYTTTVPGGPDGEYVIVQFNTRFEKKVQAVETITPMLDGGGWRVSGYYIK